MCVNETIKKKGMSWRCISKVYLNKWGRLQWPRQRTKPKICTETKTSFSFEEKKKLLKSRIYTDSHIHINYILTFLSFNFYYLFLI